MTERDAKRAIKEIAKKNRISIEEVREEMSVAIMAGYRNPDTKEVWKKYIGEDGVPSPEFFICKISEAVMKKAI